MQLQELLGDKTNRIYVVTPEMWCQGVGGARMVSQVSVLGARVDSSVT